MKRLLLIATLIVAALSGIALFSTIAESQPIATAVVVLQPTTPGWTQTGHANLNGTLIAGQFQGVGTNLTGLNATNIGTGTLADARLSGNVARLPGAQTFTGVKTFSAPPSFAAAGAPFSVTSSALVPNLNADRLDGLDSSAFLQSIPNPLTLSGNNSSHIIRGENASTASNSSSISGVSTAGSGATIGVHGEVHSGSGIGVYGRNNGLAGSAIGIQGESASTAGIAIFGFSSADSGNTQGVQGRSLSPTGQGVFGLGSSVTGANFGVYGQSNSTSGIGVFGTATTISGTTYGGRFVGASNNGRGVSGLASSASGVTFGVEGRSDSTSGHGVFGWASASTGVTHGIRGQSDSTSGRAVSGVALANSGQTYGGSFTSLSPNGVGISAEVPALTGLSHGVLAISASDAGRGVLGWATSPTGVTSGVIGESASPSGHGVFGHGSATTGTNYGVYGRTNSEAGWGVWALGRSGASGTKSFRIDHPDDPEHRYLLHYSTESPEVLNAYRGTVTLDGAGEAVVELPRYFAKINKSPSYTLTAVGAPMPNLHVAEEIDENALAVGADAGPGVLAPKCWFRVAGGKPGAKVSWRVEAVRNDRWVRRYGAPIEVEKQDLERGTIQHPELYGAPVGRSKR